MNSILANALRAEGFCNSRSSDDITLDSIHKNDQTSPQTKVVLKEMNSIPIWKQIELKRSARFAKYLRDNHDVLVQHQLLSY